MKKFLLTAVAVSTLVAPLGFGAAVADPLVSPPGWYNGDHTGDRQSPRAADQGGDRHNDAAAQSDPNLDARDHGRDRGGEHRQGDVQGRWDPGQHNGYYTNNRWHYGPPQDADYGRSGFRVGYHDWARGQRVPTYYRDRYANVDYRENHLRRPPHGYHWVRDDRGTYLLIGVATGLIMSTILHH